MHCDCFNLASVKLGRRGVSYRQNQVRYWDESLSQITKYLTTSAHAQITHFEIWSYLTDKLIGNLKWYFSFTGLRHGITLKLSKVYPQYVPLTREHNWWRVFFFFAEVLIHSFFSQAVYLLKISTSHIMFNNRDTRRSACPPCAYYVR